MLAVQAAHREFQLLVYTYNNSIIVTRQAVIYIYMCK